MRTGAPKMRRAGNVSIRLLGASFQQPPVFYVGRRSERECPQRASNEFGRRMDCSHGAGPLGASGDEQSERLPPSGQASDCFVVAEQLSDSVDVW